RRLPLTRVVASHEVAPEFREYERASTTAIDAYLGPTVSGYLEALRGAASSAGLPQPLVMRSSGGVATLAEAAAHPAVALVSGPAAGVVGAARVAGVDDALTLDMGGTSTDVCLIRGGEAARSTERQVRGFAGIDPAEAVEIVNAEMLRALRLVSVERGHDPRELALVAFGGAGPLHACALAEELGVETVLVPETAGVLSALGLAAADERV